MRLFAQAKSDNPKTLPLFKEMGADLITAVRPDKSGSSTLTKFAKCSIGVVLFLTADVDARQRHHAS